MAPASSDAMNVDTLLELMQKSLPAGNDSNATSKVKNSYSAVALFTHACMLAVGFRLLGLGEDHKIGIDEQATQDDETRSDLYPEATSSQNDVQPLPTEWDASSSYAFRYAHSQSSMEFLLKITRLGSKALVFGVAVGDDKTASFEVKVEDFISEGSIKHQDEADNQKTALRDIFISRGRISDLASQFKSSIIQKLAPGIQKAGYQESTEESAPRREPESQRQQPRRDPLRVDEPPPARPYPFDDPLAIPRRPNPTGDFLPPGFEDEYEINRPPRDYGPRGGGQPFGNIGEQDLYPPGLRPNDPLRIGPGGGYRGGGGMHPTFDDPLFGGQGRHDPYDPRAPPGARYDPVGPGDMPRDNRGSPRFPGGGGGGFGGGFGGNPYGGFGGGII